MTIDSPELRTLVRTGIKAAFSEVRAARPTEHFYAFVLFTDDDASGIVPTAHTEEGLAALVAKHPPMGLAYADSPRWDWWEWTHCGNFGSQHTEKAYRAIFDIGMNLPDDADLGTFRQSVFSLMSGVLADLDAEGFFGRGKEREAVTLFCSISDSSGAEELADRTVGALNPPSVVARYMADRNA